MTKLAWWVLALTLAGCGDSSSDYRGAGGTGGGGGGPNDPAVVSIASGFERPTHLAVDARNVYVATDGDVQQLWAVPLDGGPRRMLTTIEHNTPNCHTLVTDGAFVYYAAASPTGMGSGIFKVSVDGGEPAPVVFIPTSSSPPRACIALDGEMLYFVSQKSEIARVSTSGGTVEVLYGGPSLQSGSLAIAGGFVYWTRGNEVVQAPASPGGSITVLGTFEGSSPVIAANTRYVYVASQEPYDIIRIPAGGGPAQIFSRDLDAQGIVADERGAYISTAQHAEGGIVFIGNDADQLSVFTERFAPADMALDASFAYWVNGAVYTVEKLAR